MLLDFTLTQILTTWTAAAPLHRLITYILAELLIWLFPLVLYILWQLPESRGRFHAARKAVMMALMATVIGFAVKSAISVIWSRPRPFVLHSNLPHMLFSLDPLSFPSAHALIAVTIGTSLLFSGYRKLGWLLIAVSLLIAVGRVLAGVHYPSDVVAGLCIGVGIAWYVHREASSIGKYLPNR